MMLKLAFKLVLTIILGVHSSNAANPYNVDISQLDDLVTYLQANQNSSFARVGFLSYSNYISVQRLLPKSAKPVIFKNEDDLVNMVLNGSILAALTSGLPEQKFHDSLHIFASEVIALHSMLMAPDFSSEYPHGIKQENLSTFHLSQAINAAIAQVQYDGKDQELAKKNGPKIIAQAFTCKSDNRSNFNLPNRNEAKGLLRTILDTKEIKVLGDGPYNWGDNDGNYLIDPPIGFYPDYLDAVLDAFQYLSGPDGVTYGKISKTRIYPFGWFKLFDGTAHITEPYILLDGLWSGSGKKCENDSDCFDSDNTNSKKESCSRRICIHPNRPRVTMLRSSCTTLGTESVFYTKKGSNGSGSDNNPSTTSPVAVAFLVILSIIIVLEALALGFLVFRERYGNPLFRK